jgi:tetratricopeptide (TPR) repeat protein/lysophospholipase L1-like esterase
MRKVAPRLLLILAGPIVFFGLLEGALYLTGRFEPLAVVRQVKHQGKMFWTSEPRYGRFILQRENAPPPLQLWLPVDRKPGSLRVVMLGESAAAGFPLDEYNLGRVTRVLWDERFPGEPMEMATIAMTGVNSHILRVFAREAMQLEPDVVVLYIGHNEVIGPYGPISQFASALPSEKLSQLSLWVRNTRTGRAMERGLESVARLTTLAGEGSWIGLDEFGNSRMPADDPALDRMVGQTRENLRAIIRTALENGAKVLVCVPAVNLTDWPPMATAEGPVDVSAQAAYDKARELEAAGQREEAWQFYRHACDLDLLRFRADSRVRQLQRDLVAEFSTPDVALIDADFWLHEWNPAFRSDEDYFLEHVHLTFEGRVAVASLIVDGLAELTGRAAADGVGLRDFAGVEEWWGAFARRNAHARKALLFTDFDESQMWKMTEKLLGMNVFAGLSDREERRAAAKNRSETLLAAARERLSAERIRSAYDEASKLNSDEWIDHGAAQLWSFAEHGREFWHALETAHEKYPYFRLAHYQMASRATREKRYEEALEHVRALDQMRNSADIVPMLYGEIYWAWGKPALAIPHLETHAVNQPKDHVPWFNLGMARQMAGQPSEAASAFRRALNADPDSVMIRSALAKLLLDQERPTATDRQEALELARELLVRQSDDLDVLLVLVVALLANGRTEEAQSHANTLASRVAREKGEAELAYMQKALNEARAKFSGLR